MHPIDWIGAFLLVCLPGIAAYSVAYIIWVAANRERLTGMSKREVWWLAPRWIRILGIVSVCGFLLGLCTAIPLAGILEVFLGME